MEEGSPRNNNLLIGLALGFSVLLMAWFFADLVESKAGEHVVGLQAFTA